MRPQHVEFYDEDSGDLIFNVAADNVAHLPRVGENVQFPIGDAPWWVVNAVLHELGHVGSPAVRIYVQKVRLK